MSDISHLFALDVPQKLEIIGALWESIEKQGQPVPVSDALLAELDRRKAAVTRNPDLLVPWESILERLGRTNG